MKSHRHDEDSEALLPKAELQKPGHVGGSVLLPGLCYILASSSILLLNKYALAGFGFACPNSMLLFHCALAALLVKSAELLGYIKLEPVRWQVVQVWFPVNLLFVGRYACISSSHAHGSCMNYVAAMIATSYFALARIGIGMFTLLKVR